MVVGTFEISSSLAQDMQEKKNINFLSLNSTCHCPVAVGLKKNCDAPVVVFCTVMLDLASFWKVF